MKLSKSEEAVMHHIWSLKKAFMKDIIERYNDPKPAVTTLATLLKRMRDKGYIDYKTEGKSRLYFPLVKKTDYFSGEFNVLLKNFFGDSSSQFASFFTKSSKMTQEELTALRSIIDQEIDKKKRKS
ncbi:MAG: BlaI family penicillinase repressor [Saprospiraceae bacterium]|jgi:BlaI family penicillinase repressor